MSGESRFEIFEEIQTIFMLGNTFRAPVGEGSMMWETDRWVLVSSAWMQVLCWSVKSLDCQKVKLY